MGTIRRYVKKGQYPIGAAGVPGDASALSVESRAISRFAQTVGIISAAEGRRIMKADEKSQTIAGEAEMKRLLNATWDTFDTNPKENDYLPAYKKTEKGFDSLIKGYTNRNAQTNLRLFREQNRPAWENSVNDAVLNRKRINAGARAIKNIEAIKGYDLSKPGEKLEAEGLIGQSGDVMRGLGHSPDEVENWMAGALNSVENQAIYQQAEKISLDEGYQKAVNFVASQKIDVEDRNKILSNLASTERIRATRHKQMREQTMSTMLADVWDSKLKDPQVITNALRLGYLDDADAKYLRDAILNPDPPETTNEALIAMRYAIDGIGVTETRESALKTVISYTQQLSPNDGKAFIKEIFGEHDTKNAFWNRQAQEYMEKQIMEVASLTGILYGSGEQLALSAQALMSYDEAKKAAIIDGKPLNGGEFLELAHQTMMPFRDRVKPLLEGEKIPETLIQDVGIKPPISTESRPAVRVSKEGKTIVNSMVQPKSVEEFLAAYKAIPDKEARKRYYEKWAGEVYK